MVFLFWLQTIFQSMKRKLLLLLRWYPLTTGYVRTIYLDILINYGRSEDLPLKIDMISNGIYKGFKMSIFLFMFTKYSVQVSYVCLDVKVARIFFIVPPSNFCNLNSDAFDRLPRIPKIEQNLKRDHQTNKFPY